ncbi:MAG: 4'-phosphopantetheinyl transferase superfamily protein [Clostridia bacterium]|nr:4'-phosphopantetheinyl transferase superfamily protein [Clostridia bacterium]
MKKPFEEIPTLKGARIVQRKILPIGNAVTIIVVDTSKTKFADLATLPLVNDEDRAQADRFVQEKDKVAHLLSAYLKRKYVGHWTVTDSGKPVSQDKFFNASHCDGCVVIALASCEVGVDVENIRSVDEELKRYVSTDEEYKAIKSDRDFFCIWTAKESLAKADGDGLDGAVKDIPALPLIGRKEFRGEKYFSKQIETGNNIISVTKKGEEPFDILIKKEKIK